MNRSEVNVGLTAASAIAIGVAGWSAGQIGEGYKWLPLVALPISLAVLAASFAVKFQHWRSSQLRLSLPGITVQLAIRFSDVREQRRQYVYDFGTDGGPGSSFYLSASRRFVFEVRDNNGEPHEITVSSGWRGIPIAAAVYIALEAGTDGLTTIMRVSLAGQVLEERKLPFPIEFGDVRPSEGTIGAARTGDRAGGFDLLLMQVIDRTMDAKTAADTNRAMRERFAFEA